jgi:signal transduction histidine kinase
LGAGEITPPVKKKHLKKSDREAELARVAAQEERRRLLRDLHDRVLQPLASLRARADLCLRELLAEPQSLEQELQIIVRNSDTVITEIRRLLSDNQAQSELAAGTLERRLREELEIFCSRSGLRIEFQCTIASTSLPHEIERELYYALREGVINAVRHSRASDLRLSLRQEPTACRALLIDNGVGFDLAMTDGGTHYGLRSMRERIERLGGHCTIQTAPGQGTEISMTIPLSQSGGAAETNPD